MEMGDGDGDGWVDAGDIVAMWATAVYTQIVVRRSIDCLYDNHTSPDLRNINRRFLNFLYLPEQVQSSPASIVARLSFPGLALHVLSSVGCFR